MALAWLAFSTSSADDFERMSIDPAPSLDMDKNGLLLSSAAPPLPVICNP